MMFSVIVATYNSETTLACCLDSLRNQQAKNFEVLIADGGSTDRTLAILDTYSDLIAHFAPGPDRGLYDAWNKVIPHARGEWLLFLGSDDWLDDPQTLADLALAVSEIPEAEREVSYVYGETELIEAGEVIERLGCGFLPDGRLGPDEDIIFSHTGLLHHRTLFEQFGLFDASLRLAGDYEFMLRTRLDPRGRFHRVPMVVARMASGGMSTGALSRYRFCEEMILARRSLGLKTDPAWLLAAKRRAAILRFLHKNFGEKVALVVSNCYRVLRGKKKRQSFS
jgi:hypothetical protein